MITTKLLGSQQKKAVFKKMSEAKLFKKLVKFATVDGQNIELEAVYEDSLPNGSSLGTVVGFHGSPGSHNDFKYVRDLLDQMNIRFIGINYPGFTFTPEYSNQQHNNEERQNYSNAVLDELGIEGKMVYMGHSRGCENALQTAVGRNAHGLVLVNPTGLRIHKGVSPMYKLTSIDSLYKMLPNWIGNQMMLAIYRVVGFKITTGEEAINALRSMTLVSLGGQLEYIEKTNEMNMKKLIVFSGRDHLVEPEIVFESLEKHKDLRHFDFEETPSDTEQLKVTEEFENNRRGASVFVAKDSHFQNKLEADLIAKSCRAMFDENKTNPKL